MSFIAGAGATNVDLLYTGMPRIPDVGEEIYSEGFELQLGGGLPATLINLGRLGIPAKIATELGNDIFSEFAKKKFAENKVSPVNLYKGEECRMSQQQATDLLTSQESYQVLFHTCLVQLKMV